MQAKIKDLTRKMMAVVSELSMNQVWDKFLGVLCLCCSMLLAFDFRRFYYYIFFKL